MAVPFRRTSKTKKRMRRTHLKKEVGALTTCPKCGATLRPHRACTKCGYYKDNEVVAVKKADDKEEE
jgi:large subunit ribosomal protein L32